MLSRPLVILCALFAFLPPAGGEVRAQSMMVSYDQPAVICPVGNETAPPDFDGADCRAAPLGEVDPQGRDIWVRVVFDIDALPAGGPVGLFLSAKASSAVWLNGVYLGANGAPGRNRQTETPGQMDAVFYAPREVARIGENEAVLRLSSHHGFLRLDHPFHYLIVAKYADPSRHILRAYWPSLLTFGAFLLGAIYFGVSSLRNPAPGASSLLFLLSLLATAQLFLETSRGLFAYNYPFHDLRLVLITTSAVLFGLCLLIHTANRFAAKRRLTIAAAGAAGAALAVLLSDGFDAKTLFGLMVPLIISAAVATRAAIASRPAALAYAVALGLFIVLMLLFLGEFLDTGFYYGVAALLLFLMGQQAASFARERELRQEAGDRARRLEIALERAQQKTAPERLKIQNGGKTRFIAAGEIAYCKGAGDYVEIFLSNGERHLHLAKLQDLEQSLPQTFLRVHRSYLVNTDYVQFLRRESSGVGSLTLANGDEVPVSRRILPKVRSALN